MPGVSVKVDKLIDFKIKKDPNWARNIKRLERLERAHASAARKVLKSEAKFLERKVKEGIRKQAPGDTKLKRLKLNTRKTRRFRGIRGQRALLANRELFGAIKVKMKPDEAFIGITGGTNSRGYSLVRLAETQEKGRKNVVIELTKKMRALLGHMLNTGKRRSKARSPKAGANLIIFNIPARPFLQPVADKYGKPSVALPRWRRKMAAALAPQGVTESPTFIV